MIDVYTWESNCKASRWRRRRDHPPSLACLSPFGLRPHRAGGEAARLCFARTGPRPFRAAPACIPCGQSDGHGPSAGGWRPQAHPSLLHSAYLNERFPDPPLGRTNPQARYHVQKRGKYVETHIAPHLAILRWAKRIPSITRDFDRLTPERRALWEQAAAGFSADDVAASREALCRAASRIAGSRAGAVAGGAGPQLADSAVFPHVEQFPALALELFSGRGGVALPRRPTASGAECGRRDRAGADDGARERPLGLNKNKNNAARRHRRPQGGMG